MVQGREMKEVYLGDGLYASFDGHSIRLRAPRSDGDHEVYLDHKVFKDLMKFAEGKLIASILVENRDATRQQGPA